MDMNHFRYYGLCALLLATTALAGCGIKPSSVAPPEEAKDTVFPRAYPDPSTLKKP